MIDAAASAPIARDGPFGIAIGEPLTELGSLEKLGEAFRVVSPPRPSPGMLSVTVEGFPGTGVCMIAATSAVNHDDPNAVAAKQLVDQLAGILASKYGPFTGKIDQCNNNSTTCGQYLTQAIEDQSAKYVYAWKFNTPRPDHILGIQIFAHSLDANSTVARVQYFGDNIEACETAEKASQSSAF